MKNRAILRALCPVLLVGLLVGCSDDDSAASTNPARITVTSEAPDDECPNGGIALTVGNDTNGNGSLDDDEAEDTTYVCNGADGANGSQGANGTNGATGATGATGTSGNNSLIEVTTEPPGSENCDGYGGQKVSVGVDANGNGALDDDEVESVEYVCNVPEKKSLVSVTSEPKDSANCDGHGGYRIATGFDDNGNGVLDPDEETDVTYVCDDPSAAVDFDGVKLTLVNNSDDTSNSKFAIVAGNGVLGLTGAVAWTVVENNIPGNTHPFTWESARALNASDSSGNYTPQIDAINGKAYSITNDNGGIRLAEDGVSNAPNQFDIKNASSVITGVHLYKSGRLYAQRLSLFQNTTLTYQLRPKIFVGAVPATVVQGQTLTDGDVTNISTEFSLLGIASADIVITGGGANPFVFSLANITTQ
jgi:hypothetical protein